MSRGRLLGFDTEQTNAPVEKLSEVGCTVMSTGVRLALNDGVTAWGGRKRMWQDNTSRWYIYTHIPMVLALRYTPLSVSTKRYSPPSLISLDTPTGTSGIVSCVSEVKKRSSAVERLAILKFANTHVCPAVRTCICYTHTLAIQQC